MKKIIFVLVMTLLLSLAIAEEPQIDYKNAAAFAEAIKTQGTAITAEQWAFGNNLEKAIPLSLYPEARIAVQNKHPGRELDLTVGDTTYSVEKGVVKNGLVEINLNDPSLKGTKITALKGGGFAIGKGNSEGSSSNFEWEGNKFNLEKSEKPIEINNLKQIVLPKGAKMTDLSNVKITSQDDRTIVWTKGKSINIQGIAKFKDGNYDGFVGQSGKIMETGSVEISLDESGLDKYKLTNAALYRSKGFSHERVDQRASGENIFIADGDFYKNVLNENNPLPEKLSSRWQRHIPGMGREAVNAAIGASINYVKRNPGVVKDYVEKNLQELEQTIAGLANSIPFFANVFTGNTRIGFGHGGAGLVSGNAGLYAGVSGEFTAEVKDKKGRFVRTSYDANNGDFKAKAGLPLVDGLNVYASYDHGIVSGDRKKIDQLASLKPMGSYVSLGVRITKEFFN